MILNVQNDHQESLSAEVHAAREALSGFAKGQPAPELLAQVHKLLLQEGSSLPISGNFHPSESADPSERAYAPGRDR